MEGSVNRSSLIGDSILYTLNQEQYLRRYLEDGHLSIDNNSAERAVLGAFPKQEDMKKLLPWSVDIPEE